MRQSIIGDHGTAHGQSPFAADSPPKGTVEENKMGRNSPDHLVLPDNQFLLPPNQSADLPGESNARYLLMPYFPIRS